MSAGSSSSRSPSTHRRGKTTDCTRQPHPTPSPDRRRPTPSHSTRPRSHSGSPSGAPPMRSARRSPPKPRTTTSRRTAPSLATPTPFSEWREAAVDAFKGVLAPRGLGPRCCAVWAGSTVLGARGAERLNGPGVLVAGSDVPVCGHRWVGLREGRRREWCGAGCLKRCCRHAKGRPGRANRCRMRPTHWLGPHAHKRWSTRHNLRGLLPRQQATGRKDAGCDAAPDAVPSASRGRLRTIARDVPATTNARRTCQPVETAAWPCSRRPCFPIPQNGRPEPLLPEDALTEPSC